MENNAAPVTAKNADLGPYVSTKYPPAGAPIAIPIAITAC
jgi:hypothetical protein